MGVGSPGPAPYPGAFRCAITELTESVAVKNPQF